jgi:hypothetical protein
LSEPAYRCSIASTERGEPLAGTASTFRRFLLIEFPGPWGVDALLDSRLPAEVGRVVRLRARPLGIRVSLIRRHGRSRVGGRMRVFAAYAHPSRPWLETTELAGPDEIAGLDLDALSAGESLGLDPWNAPLFLTCTHGRHDACCAERGRPVARALFHSHPEEAWDVSHIGGDRFAGTVVVLPHGLYYGRLDPESASRMAVWHHDGRLDLEHLRGRSGYPFVVQAAEIFLRRRLDLDGLDDVRFVSARAADDLHTTRFSAAGAEWDVVVRRGQATPQRLTCSKLNESPIPTHELESIAPAAS